MFIPIGFGNTERTAKDVRVCVAQEMYVDAFETNQKMSMVQRKVCHRLGPRNLRNKIFLRVAGSST